MDREDLEVLVIRQAGSERADALLYDPMPGGSGLLEQICARFAEVVEAALRIVRECPGECEKSCIDCLQTFRNTFFARYLDRKNAADCMEAWGSSLSQTHEIPPRLPATGLRAEDMPVNWVEAHLRLLLARANFPEPEWHKRIELGHAFG